MTATQKVLIAAALVAAVGTGIYEAHQASTLRSEVQTLRKHPTQPAGQIQQLTSARDDAMRQLAALRADNERLIRDKADLLKLRAEVTRLREDAKMLADIKKGLPQNPNDRLQFIAETWAKNAKEIKQRLAERPELDIPEIALIDDIAWLRMTGGMGLNNEDDVRAALSEVRRQAKVNFANYLGEALWKYAEANDGQIPKTLLDLKPFFRLPGDKPPDDSILQRYELSQTGKLADAPYRKLVVEKAPVDNDNDVLFKIGPDGFHYEGVGLAIKTHGQGEGMFSRAFK